MGRYRVWIDQEEEWPADSVPEHDFIYTAASHEDAAIMAAQGMLDKGKSRGSSPLWFIVDDEIDQWRTVHVMPKVTWSVDESKPRTLAWLRGQETE